MQRETDFPRPNPIFLRVAYVVAIVFFKLYHRITLRHDMKKLRDLTKQDRPETVMCCLMFTW